MQHLSRSGARRPLILALVLTLAATTAACSDSSDTDGADGDGGSGGGTAASIQPIVASKLEADIAAAGIDPENPPDWETLSAIWESKAAEGEEALVAAATPIMTIFTKSLGIECKDCHSEDYYGVPETRKNLVMGMWDQWVHGLRLKEGGVLSCDSCHQGKGEFLQAGDQAGISVFMQENFVAKLTRTDGQVQACASCHGASFNEEFLVAWQMGNYAP